MQGSIQLLLLVVGLTLYTTLAANNLHGADIEDNDFAEFEDFEDDEVVADQRGAPGSEKQPGQGQPRASSPKVVMAPEADIDDSDAGEDEDGLVEDDDDEFVYLQDEEEFEGFMDKTPKGKGQERPPDLTIQHVPAHLRTNWDSFYMEMLMLAGLGVYLINFLVGKAKNGKLSSAWMAAHRSLLEENFSIVGDDGTGTDVQHGVMMKESENIYALWCSGRICCEGMLVTLKLLKRQDLVSSISRLFKPASDQIIVKVTMNAADMDSFVFCLGNKKVASKMQKDMVDLACFCPEKKKAEGFNLPSSFQILSEISEATSAVLDGKVVAAIKKYEHQIEYIHVSDQYCGTRSQDDTQATMMPETSKVLIFCFNVGSKGKATVSDMEGMKPLMMMVLHCIDKVRRIRLSKEAKSKADKNRQKLTETYSKASHTQRSEAAQDRREKKLRAEKERMMAEDDPDRQRKLEEKSLKKEAKKKQPKVKMMKIN